MSTEILNQRKTFTDSKIKLLRKDLKKIGLKENFSVVVAGSYARKEAFEVSDLDYYLLFIAKPKIISKMIQLKKVEKTVFSLINIPPAKDGAFGEYTTIPSLLENIGGNKDSNKNITQRILILLEGGWLYNEEIFKKAQSDILKRYIKPSISSHKLALFLLNDIIRFYRTACVDFEYKTFEQKKDWGIRNIKLVFSRKLLYFSGIISVAETADKSWEEKIKILEDCFILSPTERIIKICGSNANGALSLYSEFLEYIGNEEHREELKNTTNKDRKKSQIFTHLKTNSHIFNDELLWLLKNNYEKSHPIRNNLIL